MIPPPIINPVLPLLAMNALHSENSEDKTQLPLSLEILCCSFLVVLIAFMVLLFINELRGKY